MSTIALVVVPVAAVIAGVSIMIKRKQTKSSSVEQTEVISESQIKTNTTDAENIFNLRPDMREDDKEIIKFISANGGEVLESDLRKKFLQPRTTMWRAVKRLERQGVIEISKKDLQNLVKLKKDLEERRMKSVISFALLILVASMAFGGITTSAYAADDPVILKIAKRTQEQISNQISDDSSDKIKKLFEEGTQQIKSLEKSLGNNDVSAANKHFLSAMKIFKEISRHLTTSHLMFHLKMKFHL